MGNPSSGCSPVRSPMTPFRRHRHSLSISSLPQDKLAKVHCEKRASLSAVSSPAKDVPSLIDTQTLTIATFLGHGKAKDYFARRRAPGSAAEDLLQLKRAIAHATAGHEGKTSQISVIPFRGHKRVSSASNSTPSTSMEFSPRTSSSSKSYGVPKIAGSLFQTVSTKKLVRSISLPKAPSPKKADREVITSDGKRTNCDSDLTMDIEQGSPRILSASTQQNIIDITNMLKNESEVDVQSIADHALQITEVPEPLRSRAVSMRRSCKTTAEIGIQISASSAHEEERGHEDYITALFDDEEEECCDNYLPTEEAVYYCEVTDRGVQCNLSDEEEEEEEEEKEKEEEYYSDASDESLVAVPSEGNTSDMELVPYAVVRKRRRSMSASGIGTMLLKVVRDSDSGQMVTLRRVPKAESPEKTWFGVEALRARQYVLEKTAQFSMNPTFEEMSSSADFTPTRACRPESEDAIKSTYSKFVDIEIDSGDHCIELVQHNTDVQLDGAASPFQARQRSRQATPGSSPSPSYLHHQAHTNCITHQRSRQTTPGSSPSPSHLHYHTSSTYTHQRSRNATPGSSPSPLHYHASSSNSNCRNATSGSSPSPSNLHYHASSSRLSSRQATTPYCPLHEGTPTDQTKGTSPIASPIKQTQEGHSRGKPPRIDSGSVKHSLQDYFKTVDVADSNTDKVPLNIPESSRTVVSRLQAPPSGAFSRVDVYRPGAATVSILSNPSFSSSHQDRLWEEQAEIYSSGGRGTPSRDEEPNMIINLRKSPSQYYQHVEVTRALDQEVPRRRASPESGHFMQQFMTKVRGSMSPQRRAGLPPRPAHHGLEKRRNIWSSCICFSVK